MEKTIVIDGANFRIMLLKNAKISTFQMSTQTGKDGSQISRFLRGERFATEKIQKQIYRMYKRERRGTPISYDKFWARLVKVSIENIC